MKRSWKVIIPLLLVLSLLLTSCGRKVDPEVSNEPEDIQEETEDNNQEEEVKDPSEKIKPPYPDSIEKDGETVGGTLNVALVVGTPFKGIFNSFLYQDASDSEIMSPMWGSFMRSGPNHEIGTGGYCEVEFDRDAKTATYKLHPDLTWSDGVPVTSDDLIFVHECIASKDYTGIRYDSDYKNIVGIEEYHEGKADTISGLKKIDDKTLEVTFKEFYPGILWGAGLTYNVEPKHYLEDIPLKDMEKSDKVRLKPLSCGPFVLSNVVPGESVEYVPNPHWFGEKPKVDKIVYKRINPDTVVEALKSGEIDVVNSMSTNNYESYKDLSNITLLSNIDRYYQYLGFKLGKWNEEAGQIVMDPNRKMADVKLRQAIGYAINTEEVASQFYNNLRIPANSLIDPAHETFWYADLEGYTYNPEKAMQILDEAGYVDKDGDGMREKPNGEKLKINFLSMSGSEIAEPLAQYYIQCIRDVGLDVGLQNGRLIDGNAFYDMVKADNKDIDLFLGAWGTGSNPDPSGTYGNAPFNFPRFATEENDKLLKAIASEDAFGEDGIDNDYLIKAYHDWQQYMFEQAPVIPTHYSFIISAVNNRVNCWDLKVVSDWGWEKVGLLSDTPEVGK
jgi:peptide/nickel transport system substrate-binding protein